MEVVEWLGLVYKLRHLLEKVSLVCDREEFLFVISKVIQRDCLS